MDDDLLTVAAQASPVAPRKPARPTKKELAPLIAAMPQREKDALLLRLALGPEPGLRTELLHRLHGADAPTTVPGRRSAAQLLDAAHTRRAAGSAPNTNGPPPAQRLTALVGEAESAWQKIEAHIATKKTSAYDQAVTLLSASTPDSHGALSLASSASLWWTGHSTTSTAQSPAISTSADDPADCSSLSARRGRREPAAADTQRRATAVHGHSHCAAGPAGDIATGLGATRTRLRIESPGQPGADRHGRPRTRSGPGGSRAGRTGPGWCPWCRGPGR
ncbi:hypothetical protein ACVW19_005656 [Streptomyces sp. TE5632]